MESTINRDFAALLGKLASPAATGYECREEPELGKLAKAISGISDAFEEFKTKQDARIDRIETRLARPGAAASTTPGMAAELTLDQRKALETVYRTWIQGEPAALQKSIGAFIETRTMRVGVDPDGGYFSPIDSGPMVRKIAEYSPIVGQAYSVSLRSGTALEGINDLGQFAASWVGEVQSRPETDHSQVGKYRIDLKEMYAMPALTQTLIDQADIDVVAWATDKIMEAFAVAEEAAMVSGDGVSKWHGFTTFPTEATADDSRAWGKFEHVNTGAAGAFHTTKADPLIDLVHRMRPRYLRNARWYMPRSVMASIRKLKEATSDQYLWVPGLSEGEPSRLLGFPVVVVDSLPAVSNGSLSVWFGDMTQAYTVIRRPGVKLLNDPYSSKPKVLLYAYSRSGGAPVNFEALKALRFAAS